MFNFNLRLRIFLSLLLCGWVLVSCDNILGEMARGCMSFATYVVVVPLCEVSEWLYESASALERFLESS